MNDLRTIFFYFVFFVFGLIVGKWGHGYRESEPDTFKEGWQARERGLPASRNPYALHTAVWQRWEDGWFQCWHKQREERENA